MPEQARLADYTPDGTEAESSDPSPADVEDVRALAEMLDRCGKLVKRLAQRVVVEESPATVTTMCNR